MASEFFFEGVLKTPCRYSAHIQKDLIASRFLPSIYSSCEIDQSGNNHLTTTHFTKLFITFHRNNMKDRLIDGTIENVRVVVRVRPINKKEETQKCENVVTIQPKDNVILLTKNDAQKQLQVKTFKFDHVFDETCSQINVYQKVAHPIIEQIFKGYNGTIFAYGQTGSGKTFTMSGSQNELELKGIIPNTFSHIFGKISSESGEKSFVVTATYIEIYNEEIRDLLAINPNQKLELRERVDLGVYVKGLTGYTVDCVESINELINVSSNNRKTRATLMNEFSSRSHAIFTITIEAKDKITDKTTVAKLNLVDLAGSERLKRTQATGVCLKEATNINQSLFVLSNVISALVEESSIHIPYRNSKLTRLLQDSLGGNSKTAMIATISPSCIDYDESLCTLRYASRAKLIKNCVHLNIQTDSIISNFEEEIVQLQQRLAIILEKEKEINNQNKQTKKTDKRNVGHEQEIVSMENTKKELNEKISAIQNKILVGGQNLYDKAQEQIFLLESSFEEIQKLDKTQQALGERLEEKEIERSGLQGEYGSLQEEDKFLDETIEMANLYLLEQLAMREERYQEQQAELTALLDENCAVTGKLQKITNVIKETIPKSKMKKVFGNVIWNDETCDFELKGVAHVGNNLNTKRRFKKHFTHSSLMGTLVNQRKHMARYNRPPTTGTNTHKQYMQYSVPEYEIYSEEEDHTEEYSDDN